MLPVKKRGGITIYTQEEDDLIWKSFLETQQTSVAGAARECKTKCNLARSEKGIVNRFRTNICKKVHLQNIGVEKKLIFYKKWKVPIDKGYLKELEKHAKLAISDEELLIDFKMRTSTESTKNDEICEISADSREKSQCEVVSFTADENEKIWKFFLKTDETTRSNAAKAFVAEHRSERTWKAVRKHFRHCLSRKVHLTDLDVASKLKIYKKWKVPVDKEYLKKLKKYAKLWIEKPNFIIDYEMRKEKAGPFEPEEDMSMWQFLIYADEFDDLNDLLKQFKTETGSLRSMDALSDRYRNFLSKNLHLTQFSVETKLLLYKKCEFPIDRTFFEEVRKFAKLEFDENGLLLGWELQLDGEDLIGVEPCTKRRRTGPI